MRLKPLCGLASQPRSRFNNKRRRNLIEATFFIDNGSFFFISDYRTFRLSAHEILE
ncbi:MAG: hypothetical protein WBM86_25135 [Waterburya sp.]